MRDYPVRLSVIDLNLGQQPMISDNKNVISYNGEIYNFKELRKEIGESKFCTNSDAEVILKAYERWGEDCISKFRGMFAFALWDENKSSLFCARDRFGIKPFYYTVVNEVFIVPQRLKHCYLLLSKLIRICRFIKRLFNLSVYTR